MAPTVVGKEERERGSWNRARPRPGNGRIIAGFLGSSSLGPPSLLLSLSLSVISNAFRSCCSCRVWNHGCVSPRPNALEPRHLAPGWHSRVTTPLSVPVAMRQLSFFSFPWLRVLLASLRRLIHSRRHQLSRAAAGAATTDVLPRTVNSVVLLLPQPPAPFSMRSCIYVRELIRLHHFISAYPPGVTNELERGGDVDGYTATCTL